MSTYRLARHLASPSLLTDSWAGISDTGRPVVVLLRKEPWAQQAGFFERFAAAQRGWQALRQADGILPLVEVGQAEGAVCVVQDFTESEALRMALLGKPAFSVVESVAVLLQAARGLLSLEQLSPLTHGDVSASTLLLGNDGAVRLEAIGVAAAHLVDPALGPARSELLTLAPEELVGRAGPASDIFRLGLVWLELLTGKPAFGGTTHAEVKARFEKFPGVTPAHFPSLPQPIAMVLATMLSKAPDARPAISDLELMLTQVYASVGGHAAPTQPLAEAFQRLFPGRANTAPQLQQGGRLLEVNPPAADGSGLPAGAVKLARINTKRISADDVAASRALEAVEAARASARDWSLKHARDEGNPRDFTLGATLLEMQRLTLEQLDAALQHAQSLGATLFDSLCALDTLDEDEVLPIAAGLLRQQYLTGPQLLELPLGKAQAAMLSRDVAEDWQVIPLKLEAGGLTVAAVDPTRLDVLDDVKLRAKARSVTAVRATERTIQEGLARIYEGKTLPPEWATKRAATPSPSVTYELELVEGAPLSSSSSGVLESLPDELGSFPVVGSWPAMPPPMGDPMSAFQQPNAPAPFPFPEAPPEPVSAPPPPSAPPSIAPVVVAPGAPLTELPGSLDVASRLFDALLSVMGERGLEASTMIALVRSVAKQAGATGPPLDQVRLSIAAVVIAALLEGKRAFEVPSRPAAAACLGPYWREFEDFMRPLLDDDENLPADPRGVVLCLCFEVAKRVGAVPVSSTETTATLDSLRDRYPLAALAALEIVLAGH